MNRPAFLDLKSLSLFEVQALAQHVEDVTLGDVTHGHRDRTSRIVNESSTDQTVRRLHGDAANHVISEVLRYLESHLEIGLALTLTHRLHVGGQSVDPQRDASAGNSTSTMAPSTCTMRPWLVVVSTVALMFFSSLRIPVY